VLHPAQSPDDKSKRDFGYEPSLDGIRAIAVFLVMAEHLGYVHGGALGVDVFFVLSGYLITAILVSEFSVTGEISLKKFYVRRALRILPAVLLLLIVINIFAAAFQTAAQASRVRWDSLGALFYIANWLRAFGHDIGVLGNLWSLSIEEQFYLIWPLTLLFLLSQKLSVNRILMIVAAAIVLVNVDRIFLYRGAGSFNRIYNGLDTRADSLLVGCALGLAGYQALSPRAWAILGSLGAVFVGYVVLFTYPVPASFQPAFALTIGGTLFAIGVALFLAGILSNATSVCAKLLALPPLVWAGRLSYGLYLWHFFVFAFIAGWFRGYQLRLVPAQISATFLIAAISFYLLERPCLKLKKKFSVIKTREASRNGSI
jgi:peptidoglycan/LPS O-acetylase OafA/YrhL